MNTLVISDIRNRPLRRDGNEFRRESRAFAAYWRKRGHTVTQVETSERKFWAKHNLVLRSIREHVGELDSLVMFCHGFADGVSLGFKSAHVDVLAHEIARKAGAGSVRVVLYACLCAKKVLGFVTLLSRALAKCGVVAHVIGHSTSGHCTHNPNVWECLSWQDADGAFDGGELCPWYDFVSLPLWKRRKHPGWKAWCQVLKTDVRFGFVGRLGTQVERLAAECAADVVE